MQWNFSNLIFEQRYDARAKQKKKTPKKKTKARSETYDKTHNTST